MALRGDDGTFADLVDDGRRPGMGRDDVDLTAFKQAGRPRTQIDHLARAGLIRRQFPSSAHADWLRIFDERPGVFRAILRDLAEADAAEDRPNQSGRRPILGIADGHRRLMRMFGKEYSTLPFPEAFAVLCNGRSVRGIVAKTGLSRSQVQRLQKGEREPSGAEMEAICKGFACHPSYFAEWRLAFCVAAIWNRASSSPETAMNIYEKLNGATTRAGAVRDG